jgi:hypothetical protein
MAEPTTNLVAALIDFAKSLIWPAVLLWVIHRFGSQISALLSRLGSLKVAGSEWVFQPPAPESTQTPAVPPLADALKFGPDGFLTPQSLRAIVSCSELLRSGESVTGELLIFQTPKQRTWLLATQRQVFVLLDDERNRDKKRIIQTRFERTRTLPLETAKEDGTGVVKFAVEDTWWYYSPQLFPKPSVLEAAVKQLVSTDV